MLTVGDAESHAEHKGCSTENIVQYADKDILQSALGLAEDNQDFKAMHQNQPDQTNELGKVCFDLPIRMDFHFGK